MNTSTAVLWGGIAAFLAWGVPAFAQEKPPHDAVDAARAGMRAFVDGIPDGGLDRFGFRDRDEAAAAILGKALHVYTVPPAAVLESGDAADVGDLAVPTDQWQFLVTTKGRAAALLSVDRLNGAWVAVSLGSSGLAGQLGKMMEAWPAPAGHDYRLIRIYQALSDFVEVSHQGKSVGILPLTSARAALGLSEAFDPKDLRDARTLTGSIRQAVQRGMRTEQGK